MPPAYARTTLYATAIPTSVAGHVIRPVFWWGFHYLIVHN